MTTYTITKRLLTADDHDMDASHFYSAAQPTKRVEDIFDGGHDVNLSCRDVDATTGTIATLDGTTQTFTTQTVGTSNVGTANITTVASVAGLLACTPVVQSVYAASFTPTSSYVVLRGEGGVADNLHTIVGTQNGQILLMRPYNEAITLKILLGNLKLGSDIVLAGPYHLIMLVYDSTIEKWLMLGDRNNA